MLRPVALAFLLVAPSVSAAGNFPIAGLTPERRPDNAPAIRELVRPQGWEKRFFFGVEPPPPPGLGAADQGAWYTPFDRPGATGPYDLRKWHSSKGSKR